MKVNGKETELMPESRAFWAGWEACKRGLSHANRYSYSDDEKLQDQYREGWMMREAEMTR